MIMTPRTAKWVMKLIIFLALVVCLWIVYDTVILIKNIREVSVYIPFDTGMYYGFGGTVMITIAFVNHFANKDKNSFSYHYGGGLIIGHFIIVILFAPLIAQAIVWNLKGYGYVQCKDPDELSRTSVGNAYIFSLNGCESLPQL